MKAFRIILKDKEVKARLKEIGYSENFDIEIINSTKKNLTY